MVRLLEVFSNEGKIGRKEEEQPGDQKRKQTTTTTKKRPTSGTCGGSPNQQHVDSHSFPVLLPERVLVSWVNSRLLWGRVFLLALYLPPEGITVQSVNRVVLRPNIYKSTFLKKDEFTVKEHPLSQKLQPSTGA